MQIVPHVDPDQDERQYHQAVIEAAALAVFPAILHEQARRK